MLFAGGWKKKINVKKYDRIKKNSSSKFSNSNNIKKI